MCLQSQATIHLWCARLVHKMSVEDSFGGSSDDAQILDVAGPTTRNNAGVGARNRQSQVAELACVAAGVNHERAPPGRAAPQPPAAAHAHAIVLGHMR